VAAQAHRPAASPQNSVGVKNYSMSNRWSYARVLGSSRCRVVAAAWSWFGRWTRQPGQGSTTRTAPRPTLDGRRDIERLCGVAACSTWRPQDVGLLERYRDDLLRWSVAATELVTPPTRVFLPMPCPRCNARHAYHRSGAGEHVRSRALQVAETGCQCLACGAQWPQATASSR
jgi:hypothetical protein